MSGSKVPAPVNLVVALGCEAKPLIRRFKLKQGKTIGGIRRYGNHDGLNLAVSGVGKLATAAACGFIAGRQLDERIAGAAWLNIGIAGHRSMSIGDGALVHKVTDQASGRVSYPPMVLNVQCPTTSVVTVDHPETEYRQDAGYDMEASVFTATAGRFVTSELVQIYKVVSDNPRNPVEAVTEQRITRWIEGQLPVIEQLLEQMRVLAADYNRLYALPADVLELIHSVRLTASQQVQVETACRRFYALGGKSLSAGIDIQKVRSAQELLTRLESITAAL